MELKSGSQRHSRQRYVVLIVPLWNWNRLKILLRAERTSCFNRTFMELKYPCAQRHKPSHAFVLIVPLWNWNVLLSPAIGAASGFNRTFLELKLSFLTITNSRKECFNRTFMELKFKSNRYNRIKNSRVLIVPLWNWNVEGEDSPTHT